MKPMRVTDIYLAAYGPFHSPTPRRLNVNDERVLFLGISGSGKSTIFKAADLLWAQVRRYLNRQPPLPMGQGQFAMAISHLTFGQGLLVWGDDPFALKAAENHPDASLLRVTPEGFDGQWPQGDYHNLVAADAPWETRLDWASLLPGCPEAVAAANQLLVGKQLEAVDGQLLVRLNGGATHAPEYLSMGEKRIGQLCALAGAVLKPGGLLLLDEPDVHLHPSQSLGLMTTLENLVLDKEGQMWVISHKEALWQRYEDVGEVVILSREEAPYA
ncbi:MAG: AAA family ATPase [Clostridia bacterium]|nr:AAA family ATPase [Clostridia bacterium]